MWPVWSPDGRELFFLTDDTVMVARIDLESGASSQATALLSIGGLIENRTIQTYDIAPDGQSFVMILEKPQSPPTQLNVILNWLEELKRLVPTR
jgi:hypothetical protein